MISIEIGMSEKGMIQSLLMRGHSGAAFRGSDPVCGAVSALAGTFHHLVSSVSGLKLESSFEKRGELTITDIGCPPELDSWYKGVSDFLVRGLLDIERDFSQAVNIQFV